MLASVEKQFSAIILDSKSAHNILHFGSGRWQIYFAKYIRQML